MSADSLARPSPAPVALSLKRNFCWTLAGNVIYAGCQWGMLVVLAKLGNPEMVGQFSLGLAITAPIIMFANLQLRAIQATDARDEYRFGDYLGLRLITTVLALLVIAGVSLGCGYPASTAGIIVVIGLAKAFETLSDVIYGLLQRHERMDRIAISMSIKGPLSLIALGVGVYMTRDVLWGAAGMAMAWLGLLLTYDVRSGIFVQKALARQRAAGIDAVSAEDRRALLHEATLRPYWDTPTLRRLAWISLPLGIVMMLISLQVNIPRYFVARYCGVHDLGIFSALAYLQAAGITVVGALGQSAVPRLARYRADQRAAAFRGLLYRLLGIGLGLGTGGVLVAIVAGRPLLTLLYRPEYAEQVHVFIWIMVGAGIGYVSAFLGYAMTAARYFVCQLPLFIVTTTTTAAACYLLVPSYCLVGAACATVIATTVSLVGSAVIVAHAMRAQRQGPRTGSTPAASV